MTGVTISDIHPPNEKPATSFLTSTVTMQVLPLGELPVADYSDVSEVSDGTAADEEGLTLDCPLDFKFLALANRAELLLRIVFDDIVYSSPGSEAK